MIETSHIFRDLRNTLGEAHLCHQAWWLFVSKNDRRKLIVDAYNQHIPVFQMIQGSLYTSFIIKLASVFGQNRDEISLKKLPGVNTHQKFSNLWKRGRILHKYRSNVFAHRNIQMFEKNFAKETGFRYSDLENILLESCNVFDAIAKQNNQKPVPIQSCVADWLKLFEAVNKSMGVPSVA